MRSTSQITLRASEEKEPVGKNGCLIRLAEGKSTPEAKMPPFPCSNEQAKAEAEEFKLREEDLSPTDECDC